MGRSDCSSTKEGLITARLFARCGRERGEKEEARCGLESAVIWGKFVFFASRTSLWNTCVDQRRCETCFDQLQTRGPHARKPFMVCVTLLCAFRWWSLD